MGHKISYIAFWQNVWNFMVCPPPAPLIWTTPAVRRLLLSTQPFAELWVKNLTAQVSSFSTCLAFDKIIKWFWNQNHYVVEWQLPWTTKMWSMTYVGAERAALWYWPAGSQPCLVQGVGSPGFQLPDFFCKYWPRSSSWISVCWFSCKTRPNSISLKSVGFYMGDIPSSGNRLLVTFWP